MGADKEEIVVEDPLGLLNHVVGFQLNAVEKSIQDYKNTKKLEDMKNSDKL